jgi:hypothetical protein
MTSEELSDGLRAVGGVAAKFPEPLAAFVGTLLELGADVLRASEHAGEADPVHILQVLRRDLRATVSAAWQAELDRGDP